MKCPCRNCNPGEPDIGALRIRTRGSDLDFVVKGNDPLHDALSSNLMAVDFTRGTIPPFRAYFWAKIVGDRQLMLKVPDDRVRELRVQEAYTNMSNYIAEQVLGDWLRGRIRCWGELGWSGRTPSPLPQA